MNTQEDLSLMNEFLDSLLACEYVSKKQLELLKEKSKTLITNLEDEYRNLYTPQLKLRPINLNAAIKEDKPPPDQQASNPDPVDDLPF